MAYTAAAYAGPMPMPMPNGHGEVAAPCGIAPDAGSTSPEAQPAQRLAIADWDLMFGAVRARLIHVAGERLGQGPDMPQQSAELSASGVQAVVLDCVRALDQLHAALREERSQRPTP